MIGHAVEREKTGRLFRLRQVGSTLSGGWGFFTIIAMYALLGLALLGPKAPFYVSAVVSGICCLVALVHTPLVTRNWYLKRLELTEVEHVTILVVLAVYGSIIYGTLNFVIYRMDSTAFLIDRQFAEELKNQGIAEINAKQEESKITAQACDDAIKLLSSAPQDLIASQRYGDWDIQTTIPGLEIHVTKGIIPGESSEHVSNYTTYSIVRVSFKGVSFTSDSFMKPDDPSVETVISTAFSTDKVKSGDRNKSIFLQLEGSPVSRQALINFLTWRAKWERDEWSPYLVEQLANAGGKHAATPGLFLYQAIMETFSMSPGYFKPSDWMTRIVALLYAIARYVYFAILIAIIIKKLTVPSN